MSNEKAMKEAPVSKLWLSMSLPVIMVMIVNVIYNMADVYFIGQTGDPAKVAAISLAAPVFSAISAFNTLIGFGGSTAVSIALGRKEYDKVRSYTSFVFYGALFISILVGAGLLIGMNSLLPLLGINAETEPYAKVYIRILALGTPFMVVSGALGNTIRADGDSKSPMKASMAGTITNIILDPILISLAGWGCAGAAIATVAGNIISCVMQIKTAKKKESFSLDFHDFTLKPEVSLHVLSLGVPMAAGTLLMSFSHAFGNNITVRYGNNVVAARSIAAKASMLISMIIMGWCMGVQPAISYLYGAGDRKRMKEVIFKTAGAAVVFGMLAAGILLPLRGWFVGIFIDNAEIIEVGKRFMVGSLATVPVYGVLQICSTYLQATGKVTAATFTSLLQKGIVYLPVFYLMEAAFGLNGIIFSGLVTDLIATVIALFLCKISK